MEDSLGLECYQRDGRFKAVTGSSVGVGSDADLSVNADQNESELLTHMEAKIDGLSDLLMEQCRLLANFKEEIQRSKAVMEQSTQAHDQMLTDHIKKIADQRSFKNLEGKIQGDMKNHAKCLMDAIEVKQGKCSDLQDRELTFFLESKETRQRVLAAVRDVSATDLPELRHAVRDAFAELIKSALLVGRRTCRASQQLRALAAAASAPVSATDLQEVLERELELWRQRRPRPPLVPPAEELSSIDYLMVSAEINRLLQDGQEAAAFAAALSARDLRPVRALCRRTAPPAAARLPAPLRLALAQQLATDLLHHTALHCRYLEEIIISLNVYDPATSAHLPLVVGEVRKHLTNFLRLYPNHVASRRISLIVMAADNLLKYCH
ncbi:hypothetical protein ACJJTC_016717 [Scirpophaga incertulas]